MGPRVRGDDVWSEVTPSPAGLARAYRPHLHPPDGTHRFAIVRRANAAPRLAGCVHAPSWVTSAITGPMRPNFRGERNMRSVRALAAVLCLLAASDVALA